MAKGLDTRLEDWYQPRGCIILGSVTVPWGMIYLLNEAVRHASEACASYGI